jgi:hypothetical protein
MNSLIALINALTAPVSLSALKSVLLAMAGATRPYQVISGLISQSGTNAPTLIILENTTGVTPTTSFIDTDVYGINATGLFTVDKTWAMVAKDGADIVWNSANQLRVLALEDLLDKSAFEIRIYE